MSVSRRHIDPEPQRRAADHPASASQPVEGPAGAELPAAAAAAGTWRDVALHLTLEANTFAAGMFLTVLVPVIVAAAVSAAGYHAGLSRSACFVVTGATGLIAAFAGLILSIRLHDASKTSADRSRIAASADSVLRGRGRADGRVKGGNFDQALRSAAVGAGTVAAYWGVLTLQAMTLCMFSAYVSPIMGMASAGTLLAGAAPLPQILAGAASLIALAWLIPVGVERALVRIAQRDA